MDKKARIAKENADMLNEVYKTVSEQLGMDAALELYRLFRGQQISFPTRFFDPEAVRRVIAAEYDGTNVRQLAARYGYSEKTIRRIIREGKIPPAE